MKAKLTKIIHSIHRSLLLVILSAVGASANLVPEKEELRFGFIKLTDCAPLVIAKELGFFEDEGLYVELEAQANWKVLIDRVISGELDGAHMLAGQPLAATIGYGTNAHIITPFSMDLNGNAITVSNDLWKAMQEAEPSLNQPQPPHPITAESLIPIVEERRDRNEPLRFGMVFPVSTHNYELRYWLAAAGIHPGLYFDPDTQSSSETGTIRGDVLVSVTPPPQMPSTLAARTIDGYCVGEPWNQQAIHSGIGVPVVTNYDIWKNNPEKVFGVSKEWADAHPNTLILATKALIRAGKWLDESPENRREAVQILSESIYVGADEHIIANSMTGTFMFQKTDVREMPDFNVFFRHYATYPYYSDAIWFLTQMRRWGQIREEKPDSWYFETAKKVYRPDIYREAANLLIADGYLEESEVPVTDGFKDPTSDFIDGLTYDGREPNAYLSQFQIGIQSQEN